MNNHLHIDIETYSSVDIGKCGAYKYIESEDFEILLVAYAYGDEDINIIDLAAGEELPKSLIRDIESEEVIKCAHNANFERRAFIKYGLKTPLSSWECSAVKSAYCGLPLALAQVSKALNLGEKGKLATGKALIRYFSCPVKPTKVNGGRTRNYHYHNPEKWEEFKTYCLYDVEAEREIMHKLSDIVFPETEKINYIIDQEINDRGIKVDVDFINSAIAVDEAFIMNTLLESKNLTGLENPNSTSQLKKWLSIALQKEIKSIAKEDLKQLLNEVDDVTIKRVLELRGLLSKTSIKKYIAMLKSLGNDGRIRGLFQFYGAMRTGRWAGRLVQLQNLPKNQLKDIDFYRQLIKERDTELLQLTYDTPIPSVLSQLVRTAFIAPANKTFAVADFSAIEARVLAWLAGEKWRLEVFSSHGKIYEASASKMFGVPIESIGKGSELRNKGKVAELALGYQGGANALKQKSGDLLTDAEMETIVQRWRLANKHIVNFWYELEKVAKIVVKNRSAARYKNLVFYYRNNSLNIILPSGRILSYYNAKIGYNMYGKESVLYMGLNQNTKIWEQIPTRGGKLTENIVQAVARDILASAMLKLRENDFPIVMHVHDEVVCEVSENKQDIKLQEMISLMTLTPDWCKDIPLAADGYCTHFYKKD